MSGLPTTRAYAERIAARLRAYLAQAEIAGTVEILEPHLTRFELAVGIGLPNGDQVGLSRPATDYDNGAHGLSPAALNDLRRLLDPSVPPAPAPANRLSYDDVITLAPPPETPAPAPQPPAPKAATRRKTSKATNVESAPDARADDHDDRDDPAAD